MTRAVVFDLDGTLIDSLADIASAGNAVLGDAGLPHLPVPDFAAFVGMGARVFTQRLIAATDLSAQDFDHHFDLFMHHYEASTSQTRMFDGARAALEALKADGYALGLCTNKPAKPLAAILSALDLNDLFDAVIAGDTLPVSKPDPAPLLHVFKQLGADHAVYVGDSPVDAKTAVAAHVPFVLYEHGIRTMPVAEIPHDALFSDFSDLQDVVRKNLSRI